MKTFIIIVSSVFIFLLVSISESEEKDRTIVDSNEEIKSRYLGERGGYEEPYELEGKTRKDFLYGTEKQEELSKETEITKKPVLETRAGKTKLEWGSLTGVSAVIGAWQAGEVSSKLGLGKVYKDLAPEYMAGQIDEVDVFLPPKKGGKICFYAETGGIPIGHEPLVAITSFAEADNNVDVLDAIKRVKPRGEFFIYEPIKIGGKNFLAFRIYDNQKLSSSIFFSVGNLKEEFDKYYMTYILLEKADQLTKEKKEREAKECLDWAIKVSDHNIEVLKRSSSGM